MTNLAKKSLSSLDSLRSLQQEIEKTLLLTGKHRGRQHHPPQNSNYKPPSIPPLNVPFPGDVEYAFNDFSLSPQVLERLKQAYRNALQQLQQIHRQKFEEASSELHRLSQTNKTIPVPLLIEALRTTYESTYAKRVSMIKDEITALRLKHPPHAKKIPFNVKCTPLLEKYFEKNAYPSGPDRHVLAQKTAMTPRQIEVWFQNHRKRAKENGQAVNRMPPNMPQRFIPSGEKSTFSAPATAEIHERSLMVIQGENGSSHSKETRTSSTEMFAVLDPTTKSRVFPCPFSPSTAIYHSQSDTTFSFPPPMWLRTPSSRAIPRSDIILDDFIATFASKLNVREGPTKSRRRSSFRSQNQCPWFFATTTVPSCSPHPAFIHTTQTLTPSTQPSRISSSITTLSPASLVSPANSFTSSDKQPRLSKKAAPFLKRYPSKYHPYNRSPALSSSRSSEDHCMGLTTSFGSRESAMISMPSRASSAMETGSTLPRVSWVAILEPTPSSVGGTATRESTPPSASRMTIHEFMPTPVRPGPSPSHASPPTSSPASSDNRVPSSASEISSLHFTASSGSRIASFDSTSSFGSRTSSLSSVESPFPISPTLQPQTDVHPGLVHEDLQFLDEMSDFDRLLADNTQLSFNDDIFSPKSDGMLGYALPYFQNTLASLPINFIQTFS